MSRPSALKDIDANTTSTASSIRRPRTGTPNTSAPKPIGRPTSNQRISSRHTRYDRR